MQKLLTLLFNSNFLRKLDLCFCFMLLNFVLKSLKILKWLEEVKPLFDCFQRITFQKKYFFWQKIFKNGLSEPPEQTNFLDQPHEKTPHLNQSHRQTQSDGAGVASGKDWFRCGSFRSRGVWFSCRRVFTWEDRWFRGDGSIGGFHVRGGGECRFADVGVTGCYWAKWQTFGRQVNRIVFQIEKILGLEFRIFLLIHAIFLQTLI